MLYRHSRLSVGKPDLHWNGLSTFLPVRVGVDEYHRRVIVLGWSFTGIIRIALWYARFDNCDCADMGFCPRCGNVICGISAGKPFCFVCDERGFGDEQ